MQAILAGPWLTRPRVAVGVVVLAATLGVAALHEPRSPAAAQHTARGNEQAHCLEGVWLVHDVQWAAACMQEAERGHGSGIADCDLPPERAARLNALLQEAQQRCSRPL